MSIVLSLLANPVYIEQPAGALGWLGWFILLGILVILARRWWGLNKPNWKILQWAILVGLLILVPLTSLLVLVRFPAGVALPPPGKPVEPTGPALLVFAALPWTLAAGFLGPMPAMGLAALSGIFLALWETHNPFTPLEYALLGLCFGALINQNYRTYLYRLIRHPLVAVLLLSAVYPFLLMLDILLSVQGSLANRLDYALTHAGLMGIATAGSLLVGGFFAEAACLVIPTIWGNRAPLVPSPAQKKLESRFLYNIIPLAVLLLLGLLIGDWLVAGNSARGMLRDRMASTARMASDTIPFFIDSGQGLIQQLSRDARLYTDPIEQLPQLLSQDLRAVPFFHQLFVLDESGHALAGYPLGEYEESFPPPEELMGIQIALKGVPIQTYPIPPIEGKNVAQVSFIASVLDETGNIRRVLVGRGDLGSNPFTAPVLTAINTTVGSDGQGMLLDSRGRILYHSDPALVMENYTGQVSDEASFYDETAPDGTRRMVYFQPVRGQPWSVVMSIPARRAQQMAINIALPLLGMILLLFVLLVILLRFGLRVVSLSLRTLGFEVNRISSGQLDQPLVVDGEDEIGQLRRAFESMRVNLKARMDELNRLLQVSQGVASSLEIKEAVRPVLDSALASGACAARIVLAPFTPAEMGEEALPSMRFGQGPSSNLYSSLDDQVLGLARRQDRLVLTNLGRVRVLNVTPGTPKPEAVLALALRHENLYYGALWMAYDRPHPFNEDELRFMVTLAGQAALAAANSRLFQSAEIGRQRLAAVLASTPDPVLVTDQNNRLILSNPAAWQALGLGANSVEGKTIDKVITQKDLLRLMSLTVEDQQSAEIALVDNRVYLATASTVISKGQREGRVCLMRDITHFKELDTLKSEFVSTVSHDLRSPLTLMRGYTTMIEMVGALNDQQVNYVRKITTAVDSMSHLVNNLLDLGRIEAGVDLQLEMVLVHDVVEKVVGSLTSQAAQKQIELAVDIPLQAPPLIEADQALIHQAVYNLVENGIKYTNVGGKVKISLRARQDSLVFEVSDTGIGIAPVDIPRLFEKFYRGAQREAKKQHGTGLGLAIVKSIAERHGGKVWVESQLGKGSTFYFMVPIRQIRLSPRIQPG